MAKQSKKKIKSFTIKDSVFKKDLKVLLCSYDDGNKYFKKTYNLASVIKDTWSAGHFVLKHENGYTIHYIWIDIDNIKTERLLSIIIHEISHCVESILNELELENIDDELRACYLDFWFDEILKKLRQKKIYDDKINERNNSNE